MFVYNYKHSRLFVYYYAMCTIAGYCLFIGCYVYLCALIRGVVLVALKVIPRRVCAVFDGWLLVYCVLRPFRGSLGGFRMKDDSLCLFVLFGLFWGIKKTAGLFSGFFY